eukprot:scaffold977_cov253-Pinguiococcus_pyrenoidosus.AAC.33
MPQGLVWPPSANIRLADGLEDEDAEVAQLVVQSGMARCVGQHFFPGDGHHQPAASLPNAASRALGRRRGLCKPCQKVRVARQRLGGHDVAAAMLRQLRRAADTQQDLRARRSGCLSVVVVHGGVASSTRAGRRLQVAQVWNGPPQAASLDAAREGATEGREQVGLDVSLHDDGRLCPGADVAPQVPQHVTPRQRGGRRKQHDRRTLQVKQRGDLVVHGVLIHGRLLHRHGVQLGHVVAERLAQRVVGNEAVVCLGDVPEDVAYEEHLMRHAAHPQPLPHALLNFLIHEAIEVGCARLAGGVGAQPGVHGLGDAGHVLRGVHHVSTHLLPDGLSAVLLAQIQLRSDVLRRALAVNQTRQRQHPHPHAEDLVVDHIELPALGFPRSRGSRRLPLAALLEHRRRWQ